MARGATDDYGVAAPRSNKSHRLIIAVDHFLHWISSVIVMSITAYFMSHGEWPNNTHLIFWMTISAIDAFFYLPALFLPFVKMYKGYLAPFAWIFSYLWLTAFIFAAQDYNFNNCALNSPSGVNKCTLKKTLEAFAFLAFITNLIGTLLEAKLWDLHRIKERYGFDDKNGASAPADERIVDTPAAPQSTTV